MLPKDEAEELERLNAMSNGILDELKVRLLEATRLALMEHVLEPLDEKVQTFVASRMSELPIEDVEAALQPEAVRARLLEEKCRLEQEAVLVSECVRIFEGHAQDFTNESF
jgi:predicted nucleotidyltransferase